jgi:prepilin-type N-terminal cleavage/methylation domain-containing protein
MRQSRRGGFTLIELLVVIAIIAVLVGMFMAAVQKAREAANRVKCMNHLKQMALAFHVHHDTFGYFPDGGEDWTQARSFSNGVPSTAPNQNWGWAYQILPYMEQQNLWAESNDTTLRGQLVEFFFCPSRRPPTLVFDGRYGESCMMDYAGNGGISTDDPFSGSPGNGNDGTVCRRWDATKTKRSQPVTLSDASIPDGAGNTLLIGEKQMSPDMLTTTQADDDQGYCCGWDWDIIRWGISPPGPDRKGGHDETAFGSAHPMSFNGAFADGSVRRIGYNVNATIFKDICKRDDGNPIPGIDD